MNNRKIPLLLSVLSVLLVLLLLTTATYAWFTFNPDTNVTPMEGKIAKGDSSLMISEKKTGPFDKQCPLNPTDFAKELYPVSTETLEKFYSSIAQNADGISTNYRDVSEELSKWLIHGTVYLQCAGADCDVYFNKTTLDVGTGAQWLASARLALKITRANNATQTYLFKLDDLGDTSGADTRKTVESEKEVVVRSVDSVGAPTYADDPALAIGTYFQETAGAKALLSMQTNEIAEVEYWLYLEGCDPQCYNPVQNKDITLQLGFAGTQRAQ